MKVLTKIVIIAAVLSGAVSIRATRNGDALTIETTVSNPEAIMNTACDFVSDAAHMVSDTIDRCTEKQTRTEDGATDTGLFRIRLSWEAVSSQIGAYQYSQNAISACPRGYSVYDENGRIIYTAE